MLFFSKKFIILSIIVLQSCNRIVIFGILNKISFIIFITISSLYNFKTLFIIICVTFVFLEKSISAKLILKYFIILLSVEKYLFIYIIFLSISYTS